MNAESNETLPVSEKYMLTIKEAGSIWQKDDTKCENFRCKVIPC